MCDTVPYGAIAFEIVRESGWNLISSSGVEEVESVAVKTLLRLQEVSNRHEKPSDLDFRGMNLLHVSTWLPR